MEELQKERDSEREKKREKKRGVKSEEKRERGVKREAERKNLKTKRNYYSLWLRAPTKNDDVDLFPLFVSSSVEFFRNCKDRQ